MGGGRAGKENLLNFFENLKTEIDIFCLQEIWSAPYKHLEGSTVGGKEINQENILVYGQRQIPNILPDFKSYFHSSHLENYGLMTLIKNKFLISDCGDIFVHKYKDFVPDGDIGHHARNMQYFTTQSEKNKITIINFHGLWNGQGKNDSEDRIKQSENILNFIRTIDSEIILCGDFNLLPDTKSIKMFEDFGLINLIKKYNIKSTRTSHYTKTEKFADYIFVSDGIIVNEFKVLPDEISDHSPLLLDFN